MQETGGRRIKRSIFIDVNSIKFCDNEMIKKFKKYHLLTNYINKKEQIIKDYNLKNEVDENVIVNSRKITNIGTFRKYIEFYLKENELLKQKDFTLLVRQLQVTPTGLPLEIYVFTNDTSWVNYEAIQSDIFDHIFSVINQFDLKLFQNPTGADFRKIK